MDGWAWGRRLTILWKNWQPMSEPLLQPVHPTGQNRFLFKLGALSFGPSTIFRVFFSTLVTRAYTIFLFVLGLRVCRLTSNYAPYPDGNVPRQGLYFSYRRVCDQYGIPHINTATLGKAIRLCFPTIKTRRLGVRGNSKYHCEFQSPSLNFFSSRQIPSPPCVYFGFSSSVFFFFRS